MNLAKSYCEHNCVSDLEDEHIHTPCSFLFSSINLSVNSEDYCRAFLVVVSVRFSGHLDSKALEGVIIINNVRNVRNIHTSSVMMFSLGRALASKAKLLLLPALTDTTEPCLKCLPHINGLVLRLWWKLGSACDHAVWS